MFIILANIWWMSWNVFLGMLPWLVGSLMEKSKNGWSRWLYLAIWLVFLPNALYLLTDIIHFGEQWHRVGFMGKHGLMFQYGMLMALGVSFHFLSLEAMWKAVDAWRDDRENWWIRLLSNNRNLIMIAIHLLVGVGIVMGRVLRTNSWNMVTHPSKVFMDFGLVLTSSKLVYLAILMGGVSMVSYLIMAILIKNQWGVWKQETRNLKLLYLWHE